MARTYTVITHNGDGTTTEQVLEMSPEMERIANEAKAFDEANPGFWCKCAEPQAEHYEYRGHSVDVGCKCGGWMQIG